MSNFATQVGAATIGALLALLIMYFVFQKTLGGDVVSEYEKVRKGLLDLLASDPSALSPARA